MILNVIILAAGQGKRMASKLPKVLHRLGGVTLLERVVKTAQQLSPDSIFVVYGNGGAHVREHLTHLPVKWVEQKEQLGTGHAVMQALPFCNPNAKILVLYGDVPLISVATLQQLLKTTPSNGLGLIVTHVENPTGFGRIIRNAKQEIIRIVEHRDASDEERLIQEINTGILTSTVENFKQWLPALKNSNQQHEYYLTDTIAMAVKEHCPINGVPARSHQEVAGVNNGFELAILERYYQEHHAQQLALTGVRIMDYRRLDIRCEELTIGQDTVLDVNVILEGRVKIGSHCSIGPNVILHNVTLGDHVTILANSVIEDSEIADHCEIGPFARLRPGTHLEKSAKVGNFVEIKKSLIGENSKVNHLSYIGDATLGKYVNIGAGTITCNYDGANKWPTIIGDHVFIGSNNSLVAPVTLEDYSTTGAGSTITKTVPAHELSISRAPQKNIANWQRPKKST